MAYEAERQYEVWQETGQKLGDVPKQTRGWDDVGQRHPRPAAQGRIERLPLFPRSRPGAGHGHAPSRSSEVRGVAGRIAGRIAHAAGSRPTASALRQRRAGEQGRPLVDYYVELAELCGDGKLASNWVQQDVLRTLNEQKVEIEQFPVRPRRLAELLKAIQAGRFDTSRGREVFTEMVASGKSAAEVMQAPGHREVDEVGAGRVVPGTGRGQSQDRGRHARPASNKPPAI